ncbi:MAG: TolC family protein [Bacteroidetes bacterium]|nr:TolC family protein [Bacteroidota bacterium]
MLKKPLLLTAILLLPFIMQAQDKFNLQQLIEYALTHSTQIQRGVGLVKQSEADFKTTQAGILPSLNASVSNNYNFGRAIDPTTNQFSTERTQTNYYSLSSDVLLFNGLQRMNQLRQVKWQKESSTYSLQKTKDDIALTVANYYLQILMLTEREKQVENQLANSKNAWEKMKILVANGAQAQSKELEAEAQKATDEVTLIDIQNQLKNVYRNLKQYINYDITKELQLELIKPPLDEAVYTNADLDKAINERYKELPAVKQAEANFTASKYALQAANGGFFPKLYASGSLHSGYSSSALKISGFTPAGYQPIGFLVTDSTPVISPKYNYLTQKVKYGTQLDNNFGQSAGLSLNIPIFNGLQQHHTMQTAKINLHNADLTLTEAKNKVRYDIYQAYESIEMTRKKYIAAKLRYDLQAKLFEKIDLSYQQGVAGYYEWNTARTNLNSSQSEALQATYEYIFQKKVFEFYLGKAVTF